MASFFEGHDLGFLMFRAVSRLSAVSRQAAFLSLRSSAGFNRHSSVRLVARLQSRSLCLRPARRRTECPGRLFEASSASGSLWNLHRPSRLPSCKHKHQHEHTQETLSTFSTSSKLNVVRRIVLLQAKGALNLVRHSEFSGFQWSSVEFSPRPRCVWGLVVRGCWSDHELVVSEVSFQAFWTPWPRQSTTRSGV